MLKKLNEKLATNNLNLFSTTIRGRGISTLIVSAVFLMVLFCAQSGFAKMGSIEGEKVNIRSGPGTNYKIQWEYGKGFPLKIVSRKGNWLKVKDFENDIGWVHKKYVTSTPHMVVKVFKKKKKKINIRSGPGQNRDIVARAYYGVVLKTLEQRKGWVRVRHEKGVEGWIKRSLLWGF